MKHVPTTIRYHQFAYKSKRKDDGFQPFMHNDQIWHKGPLHEFWSCGILSFKHVKLSSRITRPFFVFRALCKKKVIRILDKQHATRCFFSEVLVTL